MSNLIDKNSNMSMLKIDILRSNKLFGFWLYLMSDCIIFATLFSVYVVMRNNIAHGPSEREIFNFSIVILESFLLLCSSFSYSFIFLEIEKHKINKILLWFGITFLLGIMFVMLEIFEFYNLIEKGYIPSYSGFLSSFFTLLSIHGLHIILALIWILVMIKQVIKFGVTYEIYMRIFCLSLFWHFLDIIWVFIFSIVFLIGAI
ncbi:MAG: cytochrome o ubiquinol oxidase subunit III [Buchnera aphidicola (Floraphis choui)]